MTRAFRHTTLAVALFVGASAAQAQTVMTPGPLTDSDKAEITKLWSVYRDTLFACNGEGYADLFATPGGYFASAPRGEIRERRALMEMVVGYDRCKPDTGKPSAEPAPRNPTPVAGEAASRLPAPVIEPAPEGAKAKIINSRGGGYYDDVYVKTPKGWKFKSRTVISDDELRPVSTRTTSSRFARWPAMTTASMKTCSASTTAPCILAAPARRACRSARRA
jgi:hypothetical protein